VKRLFLPCLLLGFAAIGGVYVWFVATHDEPHERVLVEISLIVALATAIFGIWRAGDRVSLARIDRARLQALATDVGLVALWSGVVRFALAEPNILTAGGPGYSRVMSFRRGFGGLSVLVDWLFPDATETDLWHAIPLPWVLAALAPPLLVVLARSLGLPRRVALLAGLCLASIPAHAAMYSSDFLMGGALSVTLAGWACLAHARESRPFLFLMGGALLGYAVWWRPEAPIALAIAGLIVLPRLRLCYRSPALLIGAAWAAVNGVASAGCTLAAGSAGHASWSGPTRLVEALVPYLADAAVVPPWLWIPFVASPVLVVLARDRRLALLIACFALAMIPLAMSPALNAYAGTHVELFRYGTWALPWVVLGSASVLDRLAALMARPVGTPRARAVAVGVVALALSSTPLFFTEYLGRSYTNKAEEAVLRSWLPTIESGCQLIVPDEKLGSHTHEHMRRFRRINDAALEADESNVQADDVVGMNAVLEGEQTIGECAYFFYGVHCRRELAHTSASRCEAFVRWQDGVVAESRPFEFFHHRLIVSSSAEPGLIHDPALELSLYRLGGPAEPGDE